MAEHPGSETTTEAGTAIRRRRQAKWARLIAAIDRVPETRAPAAPEPSAV